MFQLTKQIGIDLGTENVSVWVQGSGVVLREPAVVAVSEDDGKVVAVGKEAKAMSGRTSGNIVVSRPMQHGVIADYAVTEALLRYLLQRSLSKLMLLKPEVMISVPAGSTQVERRAVLDAAMSAGAGAAYLVDQPLAAMVGAGVPVGEASGNMILNIGAGAAECAVVSMGGVVVNKSLRVGGNALDEAIRQYLRKTHGLNIGAHTAELIKHRIGTAIPLEKDEAVVVRGRDAATGLPKEVTLQAEEISHALEAPLQQILGIVRKVLADLPPELASDLIDKGVLLTGGTALLRNIERFFTREIGVPVSLAEEPDLCVIRGIGIVFDNLDMYKRSLVLRR